MKKLLSYALALVLLVSVLAGIPNSEVFVVDAVSTATTDNPAPGQAVPAPSAVPAVSNTSAGTNRLLADGSFGEDVKLLQTMLNNNGYALKADGIFGKLTQAAVMDYQSKNSLVSDGIVGPKTLAKLVPAPAAPVAATPVAEEKPEVDAVTSASIVSDAAAFEKAISKDGKWIICTLNDLVIDKPLVLEGDFHDKNDPAKDLKRKIGLYTHNNPENKKIATHSFTLKAPSLTIKSPSATLQYGYFVGDIYVEANDFSLVNNTVTGNIYFTTQEARDTFTMDAGSSVSGVLEVKAE